MQYMLDTNACIWMMKLGNQIRNEKIKEYQASGLAISSVVLYELQYGICKSAQTENNQARLKVFLGDVPVLDFGMAESAEAALIRCELEKRGAPIGPFDILIAAHARALAATLVTHNTREFARVRGLKTVDWQKG